MRSEIYSCFKLKHHKILKLSNPIIAYQYFPKYRINLLNGIKEKFDFNDYLKELDEFKLLNNEQIEPRVIHLYFELGYLFKELKTLDNEVALAIDLQYQEFEILKQKKEVNEKIKFDKKHLSKEDYLQKFNIVQDHLRRGNCYQVNLTFPIELEVKDFELLYSKFTASKKLSAYAHWTNIPCIDFLFLSNSPECLFYTFKEKIYSMPIKGTVRKENADQLESRKNIGELNMITDLMRNDLSQIERKVSHVDFKKKILKVPSLIHLYSRVSAKVTEFASLKKTLHSLFPGGSITGAPKKRVLEYISEIENYNRGLYCGSTFLSFNRSLNCSINIRSLQCDLRQNTAIYGTGGGITLLSEGNDEYEEALNKFNSFEVLFK